MNHHRLTWSQTRPPELQNMYSVLSILLRIPDLKDQKLNGWHTKKLNFVVWPKDDILLTGSGVLLLYLIVSSDLKLLTFGFCDGISSVRWWTFGRRFIGNFLSCLVEQHFRREERPKFNSIWSKRKLLSCLNIKLDIYWPFQHNLLAHILDTLSPYPISETTALNFGAGVLYVYRQNQYL